MANRFNFRLWDKQNKCFDKDFRIEIEPENEKNIIEDNESILMQSTGLEDKNGKEIFEDDIAKIVGTNEIFIVKYYDNFCCFGLKVEQDGTRSVHYNLDKKIAKDIEIIGNIYENKELLEK